MKLLTYKDIYNYYEIGNVFYDKNLNEYYLIQKYFELDDQVIIYTDILGQQTIIHSLTLRTRLLLSLGINKVITSIHWNKPLFYTFKQYQILKTIKMNDILKEYDTVMKDGLEKGIITEEEYNNPKLLKN